MPFKAGYVLGGLILHCCSALISGSARGGPAFLLFLFIRTLAIAISWFSVCFRILHHDNPSDVIQVSANGIIMTEIRLNILLIIQLTAGESISGFPRVGARHCPNGGKRAPTPVRIPRAPHCSALHKIQQPAPCTVQHRQLRGPA